MKTYLFARKLGGSNGLYWSVDGPTKDLYPYAYYVASRLHIYVGKYNSNNRLDYTVLRVYSNKHNKIIYFVTNTKQNWLEKKNESSLGNSNDRPACKLTACLDMLMG